MSERLGIAEPISIRVLDQTGTTGLSVAHGSVMHSVCR